MRKIAILVLLATHLIPASARAESGDTFITVDFRVTRQRIRPQPKTVHPRSTMNVVLHADGTVGYQLHVPGLPGWDVQGQKLGSGKTRVLNRHTIEVISGGNIDSEDEIRVVTITVNGQSCTANVKFAWLPRKTEAKMYSVDLHTQAFYGKATLEQVSCSIH